jgi:hypothetical protein
VDEVPHYIWGPIGVSGMPQARDCSYLPVIFQLVKDRADTGIIGRQLHEIATVRMGSKSGNL